LEKPLGVNTMGSKPQDQATATAASTGAQSNDATLDANAAANQAFSNTTRKTLFGTYNPTTNQYSGGSESPFLSPSSMDTTGLTGSYGNLYNSQANTTAQGAQRAVQTSQMQGNNQGQGKTPVGYQADQARQAYQNQANQNSTNYANDFGQQHAEAVDQYQKANNMLNSNASQTANLAVQGNTAAAGNYSNLYGTASQQTPTALGTTLGFLGQVGGGAAGAAGISKIPCWIAAELYGGWQEPRTVSIREWLCGPVSEYPLGRFIVDLYRRFGERLADAVHRHRSLRWIFTRIFNAALRQARKVA
jgi:hypothetical protein